MRTADARAHRRLALTYLDAEVSIPELIPSDILDAVASLQPALDRVRRGEWSVMITGPGDARERDTAALFQSHLLDLADALEARR